jgi:uncharacterized protein affecting Mg2+/Co2+ transport
MGSIKHKRSTAIADGINDGRVQPSWWNEDHEIGDFLSALIDLAVTPMTVSYIDASGNAAQFAISDYARGLLALADAATIRSGLGAAPLDSPMFANTPSAPTAPLGTNTNQIATMAALQAMRADLVASSPATLDTLNEIAAALGNDANFSTTITTALGSRVRFDAAQTLTTGQKAQALSNLGIVLGTAAALNVGTAANQIVQLDGSGRLPAVDGSQLTNIPPGVGAVRFDAAQSLNAAQRLQALANISIDTVIGTSGPGGIRNILTNGRFERDQRNYGAGVTVTDSAYWADGWRYIGEASATCTALNSVIGTARYNGAVQFSGTSDKGGVFKAIRGLDCKEFRSSDMVLSAVLAVTNARLGNIKMAIVQWTGTEDATTGDPVSTWGADGVNPTLAAGWSYVTTPVNLGVGTVAAKYEVTAACGSTFNNLGVMIWNDDKSYNAADTLAVTDVQLEPGKKATTYKGLTGAALDLYCKQFFYKLTAVTGSMAAAVGLAYSATNAVFTFVFPARMNKIPTLQSASIELTNGSGSRIGAGSQNLLGATPDGTGIDFGVAGGLTPGQASLLYLGNAGGGSISFLADV